MISTTKFPDALALVENPVWVGLHTDNLYSGVNTKASIHLKFTSFATAGDSFCLNFMGNAMVFSFATFPDNTGTQLLPDGGGLPINIWYNILCTVLSKNYLVSKYYKAEVTSLGVMLSAIVSGSDYNITATAINVAGMTSTPTSGIDAVQREGFKIILQLLSATDDIVYEEVLDVDASGNAAVDISEILLPQLENKFTFPSVSYATFIKHSGMCKAFSVRFAEKYENTVFVFSQKYAFHAIKAGISKLDQAVFNSNNSSFYAKLLATKGFLTNAPRVQHITPTGRGRLYFCNMQGYTTIKTMVEFYVDNSLDETVAQETISGLAAFDVLELITDPYFYIGPSNNKFVFYLTDNDDNPISEKVTYIIDTDTYYNSREILFRSGQGGYDIFMMKGAGIADADFERKLFNKALPLNFTTDTTETSQGNVLQHKNLTVNSGWITAAELMWLNDIFMNKEVYLLLNNKAVPFVIINKKQTLKKDNNFLYSLEIELQESYSNTHNSDLNNLLTANATVVGGWTIGGNFIIH
ncbi:MAG: hypothetical protein NTZ33_14530 [Bacteroidetes bacterium]|nr:hypothetical protein [Bacteroidota bacterium]